jgi:hypothetical protein
MRNRQLKKRGSFFLLCLGLAVVTFYAFAYLAMFPFPSGVKHDPQVIIHSSKSSTHSKDSSKENSEESYFIANEHPAKKYERQSGSESQGDRMTTNATSHEIIRSSVSDLSPSNLHIFYYAWYGSPAFDGRWLHWDHKVCCNARGHDLIHTGKLAGRRCLILFIPNGLLCIITIIIIIIISLSLSLSTPPHHPSSHPSSLPFSALCD